MVKITKTVWQEWPSNGRFEQPMRYISQKMTDG